MRLMRLRVNQIGLIVGLYECMRGVFIGYCWDFIWGGGCCIKGVIKGVIILDLWEGICCDRWDCKGEVWDLFMGFICEIRVILGEYCWGILGDDFIVWFYCVCWDEVDNALRKRRGFTKNVNRGYVYKYKKVKVILCVFITLIYNIF